MIMEGLDRIATFSPSSAECCPQCVLHRFSSSINQSQISTASGLTSAPPVQMSIERTFSTSRKSRNSRRAGCVHPAPETYGVRPFCQFS